MDHTLHNRVPALGGKKMSTETADSAMLEEHHDLPLLQAFVALLILTILEVLFSELNGTIFNGVLLTLTVVKAIVVGAVFMEIAYDKETTRIISFVFVVPFIAVMFLIFTIAADWRF